MCTRNQCISLLTDATPYLRERFGVKSLSIFGSMARGNNSADSDVDLCVDMPPKAFQVAALKLYLQDLLGMSVDIVRKSPYLDELLIHEINRDEIRIFEQ
jgi:predicted nucleotidyltransferase